MDSHISILQKSLLFWDISEEDVRKICNCLSARERTIEKNSFVFRAGDEVHSIYMILSGRMQWVEKSEDGNWSHMHRKVKVHRPDSAK